MPFICLPVVATFIFHQQSCPTLSNTDHALSEEIETTTRATLDTYVGEVAVPTKIYSKDHTNFTTEFSGSFAFQTFSNGKILPHLDFRISTKREPVCTHLSWIALLNNANYKEPKKHSIALAGFTVPAWKYCMVREVVTIKDGADLYWVKPIVQTGSPQPAIWRVGSKLLLFDIEKEFHDWTPEIFDETPSGDGQ